METRTMTPDESAELAMLQRRAYGPAADIGTDAAAVARLHELERAAERTRDRVETATAPAGPEAVVTAIPEFPARHVSGTATAEAPAGAQSAVSAPARVDPSVLARSRRFGLRHPLTAAVGVTLTAAALTGSATLVAQARPEAVLTVVEDSVAAPEFLIGSGMLDFLGIASDADVIRYGSYDGMDAYTVAARLGGHCLFVARSEALFAYGCGRGGLDATIDMPVGTAYSVEDFDVPAGTLLRFIHRGDEVEVWVGEPESTPTA